MTELQERAIAKIDAEIEKERGNRILEIIGEFLINLVTANSDAAEKAEIALLFTATKDSFNKMLAAVAKLENDELRLKYYSAAVKLADAIKTAAMNNGGNE